MVRQEKSRKQAKYNVLEASKAPELEKRDVGCSGPERVHMTKPNTKEGTTTEARTLPQGLSGQKQLLGAMCNETKAIECTTQN